MKSNILVTVILIVSAFLFIGGVIKKISHQRQKKSDALTIAVIPGSALDSWWVTVHNGADKAAEDASENVTVLWNGPKTSNDRETQIQCVDDAIVQKVDAVVLAPLDFTALGRSVDNVVDAGIPCIVIDSQVDSQRYNAFAATNNYDGGSKAAKILGEKMKGHGEVVIMQFIQNAASTDDRSKGFKETMAKEYPDIKIVAEQYNTSGTAEEGRQRTTDMLTKYSNVTGLFAVNQPSAIGAFKALQASGRADQIHYVAFDACPLLIEGLENNEITAIVSQNPFEIGYQGVHLALSVLRGESVEKENDVPSIVITRDNLEEIKVTYASKLGF